MHVQAFPPMPRGHAKDEVRATEDQEGLMSEDPRLRVELDPPELAALQRYIVMLHQEAHPSRPKVDMTRIFRGSEGQIFVPVTVSGAQPDHHLAMLMEHKAEQLYKQSGCRFVLLQQLETDPQGRSYVWAEGMWKETP